MKIIDVLFKLDPATYMLMILLLTFISVIVIGWLIILTVKNARLHSRYKKYIEGSDGTSIEMKIDDFIKEGIQVKEDIIKIKKDLYSLQEFNKKNLQKIGIVRFSAFSEVGSDLSFSVAILDGNNNGFVISSIYGRDDNRVYAKPLENGQSKYRLSSEEEEAIQLALKK